ncbi:potassium channel family protein [Roseibium sp.]|uniref:potassium channel family protein n=1 Tax=Roseibium sp. TaxID=1936156 RepID=UPI003B528B5C
MLSTLLTLIRLLKAIVRSWNRPHFRSGFLLAGLILLSGTIFYKTVEGWSWVNALYFSAMTVATVGVSDLAPQSTAGKLFTVIYLFVGVGVFVALFTQFARALLQIEQDVDAAEARSIKSGKGHL